MKGWLKLDNAAKIYPTTQKKHWAAMFRFSVTLTHEVDPEVLRKAQSRVLKRIPSLSCRLKSGLFWYYLEHMDGAPPIVEDVYIPMQRIHHQSNNRFIYRLLYYKNRIAAEFFHALTDGTGGMTFLMSVVAEYLHIKYGMDVEPGKYILNCDDEPIAEEYEDSFMRYAGKETIGRSEIPAYHFTGNRLESKKVLLISGSMPTDKLKELAHSYDVSIGELLVALLIYAIYMEQCDAVKNPGKKKDIKVSVPVNLRRFFPSKTLRNFSLYVNPGISGRLGEYTFEETLDQVKHFMLYHINGKELKGRFSENVATERILVVRILPLFIKKPIIRAVMFMQGDRYITSALSNLGAVKLPDSMAAYVDRIDFMLGRPSDDSSSSACVSYNGRTVMNFSRGIHEANVERYFFTQLVKLGVPVFIDSNGR